MIRPPVALVRKLHAWELLHLREVVEEQRQQLEAQAAELAEAKRALSWAEDCAESWRDDALRAFEECGKKAGLTMDGSVAWVPA